MKILIAISSPLHAAPMLAAARLLERAGHAVRVLDGARRAPATACADAIAPQFAALAAALDAWPAALVLADADHSGLLPLLLGARRQRPAVAVLGLRPWSGAAAADGVTPLSQARANATLARLGAAPLPMMLPRAMLMLPDRYLQLGVPAFEADAVAVPDNFSFLGALTAPARAAPARLPPGKPLVLLAPGAARRQPPTALAGVLASALRALGTQAQLLVADERQYLALLPRAALAVTPGCLHSALAALHAGVPVLCAGADAPALAIAARLAASGAGIGLAAASPRLSALRHAAGAILTLPRYRHAAAALSIEFDDFPAARILAALCSELTLPAAAAVRA